MSNNKKQNDSSEIIIDLFLSLIKSDRQKEIIKSLYYNEDTNVVLEQLIRKSEIKKL